MVLQQYGVSIDRGCDSFPGSTSVSSSELQQEISFPVSSGYSFILLLLLELQMCSLAEIPIVPAINGSSSKKVSIVLNTVLIRSTIISSKGYLIAKLINTWDLYTVCLKNLYI